MTPTYDTLTYVETQSQYHSPSSRVVILFGNQQLLCLHYDKETRVTLACVSYYNRAGLEPSLFWRQVLAESIAPKYSRCHCDILVDSQGFMLIPAQHHSQASIIHLAQLISEDSPTKEEVLSNKIARLNAWSIYVPPSGLVCLLDQYLPDYEIDHICSHCIEVSHHLAAKYPYHIQIQVQENTILVTVCVDKRIHLCNAYEYQSATDIYYYIAAIVQSLSLTWSDFSVFIGGQIEYPEGIFEELQSSVPNLRLIPNLFADMTYSGSPYWRYISFMLA